MFAIMKNTMLPERQISEITVKSVLNPVKGMPFRWSINPYRGCAHGCVFCQSGDTPILTADGTAKRLDMLQVGDEVIGTVRRLRYRYYTATPVLACWSTEKPAFRVILQDGTELVASGDHRFLSDRGWKFVTGAEQGATRRPHLTLNNSLLGTGAFATPPTKSVDPVISRTRSFSGRAVKNKRLRVVSIQPLGVRRLYDITTGTGDFIANGIISHNCYARRTHWFLEEDGVQEWSSKIFVKVNAPEVLRCELRRRSWKHEEVALGTATDPYQAIERTYKVTRRILEALCEFRTPVSIVTRSPMIIRDIDVLRELARRAGVTVCVSIATTDPRVAREIEPTVAPPAQRLRAVRTLTDAGIRAGVLLAPILPGLTDAQASLDAVVQAAREHGAEFVSGTVLHLGDVTRDAFFRFLGARHPVLVPRYLRMYRGKYAPDAYRAGISEIVEASRKHHGIQARRHFKPPPEPGQLPLFMDSAGRDHVGDRHRAG